MTDNLTVERAKAAYIEMVARVRHIVTAETYARVEAIPMLAHYTSVVAMESIIRSREFWFSCIPDMAKTDTSEVVEGAEIVSDALTELGPEIVRVIPYAQMNAAQVLAEIRDRLISETYAISFCEHGSDERSDRLVMWRAYGHDGNGLCMVLRKSTLLGQYAAGRFPVHWSPIEYDSPEQLKNRVRLRLTQIETAFETLPAPLRTTILPVLGQFIVSCMLSLVIGHKNDAFRDEREIRFVRSPLFQIGETPADAVYREVGREQATRKIFALPLRNYPEFGINAEVNQLLDHVIIGPSHQQDQMYADVRTLLDGNGLAHVQIRRSTIPYRAIP
jgi:hypothetical protein